MFFSGGVDSLATFLRQRDEIDTLVFVQGSDLFLRPQRVDVEAKYQALQSPLRKFALQAGKEFVVVSTNVREVFGFRYRGEIWAYAADGPATVATMMPHSHRLARLWMASGGLGRYEYQFPHGARPELIELLSLPGMAVSVPDAMVPKFERLRYIVDDANALAVLRVCSAETPDYNCGQCGKCARTITSLLLMGVEPGQAPFPAATYSYDSAARHTQTSPVTFYTAVFWGEILPALEQAGESPAASRLAEVVHARVRGYEEFVRGEPIDSTERLPPHLPRRPNMWQRAVGFPALNHGSFRKWAGRRARAWLGRRRALAWLRGRPASHAAGGSPSGSG